MAAMAGSARAWDQYFRCSPLNISQKLVVDINRIRRDHRMGGKCRIGEVGALPTVESDPIEVCTTTAPESIVTLSPIIASTLGPESTTTFEPVLK